MADTMVDVLRKAADDVAKVMKAPEIGLADLRVTPEGLIISVVSSQDNDGFVCQYNRIVPWIELEESLFPWPMLKDAIAKCQLEVEAEVAVRKSEAA